MRRLSAVLWSAALAPALFVQDAPAQNAQDSAAEPVRVSIDCQTRCDEDHFQRELAFVDWVRDQADADVHILVTRQNTGGGGSRYDVQFIGGRRFAGVRDSLQFTSDDTDTDDEVREGLTRTLGLGLTRFAAQTSRAERLRVVYDAPEQGAAETEEVRDPWNRWVFRLGMNTFLNGESTSTFLDLFGNLSATRITDASKLRLNANGSYSENSFEIDSTTTITSIRRSFGARGLYVHSVSAHWSAGFETSASVSTFRNFDLRVEAGPAVEWNLYPYAESTRRQFRFLYSVGVEYFDYAEETIFGELEETLPRHALEIAYEVSQTWGSADVSLNASQFLNDPSKNRVRLGGDADIRLVRGLSLSVRGSIAHIADQLNLPRGDLSDEDILLRQTERATSFSYFFSVGLSFTFGSTFSNVVNPRFEG